MIYITADWHLFHPKIMDYCDRPPNYMTLIRNNWNSTVNPGDVVIVLGDVGFGTKQQLKDFMSRLNGSKILVMGNHDSHSKKWYMDCGFVLVCDYLVVSGILLSHVPMEITHPSIRCNIHAHFHNCPREKWEDVYKRIFDTFNHLLLSLEYTNYTPISLQKAERRLHWSAK